MSENSIKKTYLEDLNAEQLDAVTHINGPLLIVAGAGAGKTKTITHRILHLIKSGVPGREILAITFTNKAAREMKERVQHLVSEDWETGALIQRDGLPFVSTFHSLGVFLLKEYGQHLGLSRYFTIFDKNASKKAIKEGLEQAQYDPKQFDPAKIGGAISRAKGEGLTVFQYAETAGFGYFQKVVLAVWQKYEEILKKEGALDFDDLLLKSLTLLEQFEEVRTACQSHWRYVHIDEYQDTNKVQDRIAEIICAKSRNICVVGDTDQNIYSWRGANIQNMLSFEKKYPDVKIVRLEENYRSSKTILSVANTIIQKNKYRIDKKLFTNNAVGHKVTIISNYDEAQEAYSVGGKILEQIKAGVPEGEIAVLYRANFQSRILEEACVALSIPYQMIGTKFFERKEIKDTLSFIRASLNPASTSDIRRIINVPPRGIGKVTLEKILSGQEETLSPAVKNKVSEFRAVLAHIKNASLTMKTSELIKFTIKITGIENALEKGSDEEVERLENIKELVTLALSYDEHPIEEGVDRLLTDAALATDEEAVEGARKEAIKLMTVHAAKGLEFDNVFVTGLEEGLFPHKRMSEAKISAEDAEEERRLFYVAVTRARKKLFLSYTQMRTIFGSRQVNIPSEFIFDIKEDDVEHEEGTADIASRKPLYRIDF